jgi:hypothetical protein
MIARGDGFIRWSVPIQNISNEISSRESRPLSYNKASIEEFIAA